MSSVVFAIVGLWAWQVARAFGNAVNEVEGFRGEKSAVTGDRRPGYAILAVFFAIFSAALVAEAFLSLPR